ncbi:dual specificity protein phosphatase 19-like [Saccostrea echinata]|uniref:dual specificity protein phosphatase 19-like n=1 Tax=Saccostrea echinata TaxID=191078 RepID=UPI002A7F4756|nr:dual specificity protein phosphatase 19-like [Saccostrea echinata]
MMLSSLNTFDKSSLKKTVTKVTTITGDQFVEYKNEQGLTERKNVEKNGKVPGFVVDPFADLQIGEILPDLILGSQDVAVELNLLQKYNVTHILNLATFVKNTFPEHFTYKNIDLLDIPETNIAQHFESAFQFIDSGKNSGGCVLVHCNAGISRSATIVIAYLMKTQCWSLDRAYQYVKDKRSKIRPNAGFQAQLKTFEQQLGDQGLINN